MASPSGRACDVTTNRWWRRTCSTMRASAVSVSVAVWVIGDGGDGGDGGAIGRCVGAFGGGAFALPQRFLFVQIAQDLLDAILVRDGLVELEVDLGNAPQLQPGAQLAAEERRGPIECLFG